VTNSPSNLSYLPNAVDTDALDEEVREHITEMCSLFECATEENTHIIDADVERIAATAKAKAETYVAVNGDGNRFMNAVVDSPVQVAIDLIRENYEDGPLDPADYPI
jgi:hypothetical protein